MFNNLQIFHQIKQSSDFLFLATFRGFTYRWWRHIESFRFSFSLDMSHTGNMLTWIFLEVFWRTKRNVLVFLKFRDFPDIHLAVMYVLPSCLVWKLSILVFYQAMHLELTDTPGQDEYEQMRVNPFSGGEISQLDLSRHRWWSEPFQRLKSSLFASPSSIETVMRTWETSGCKK